ncbi:MAG: hypothetical protein PHF74_04735 [Dehalococcoidales bacterium]|nr:hypothetical protein [Dehalococcoidales bacterium]
MTELKKTNDATSLQGKFDADVKECLDKPIQEAIGSDKIRILRHNFAEVSVDDGIRGTSVCVDLAIQNVSELTIASATFKAHFYDMEGNILDSVEHKVIELEPNVSRLIHIKTSITEYEKIIQIIGYKVIVTKLKTVNEEKVHLRRHEIRTIETGEEVTGIVKNISGMKTDATIIANFYNYKEENIGNKVVLLKNIEPNSIKKFHFIFKPEEGDTVSSCSLFVSDIEECE